MIDEPNGLDRLVTRMIEKMAARTDRRSWLGMWGRVVMGAIGLELLPILPSDRRARADVGDCTAVNCTHWKWCGMTGRPCSDCKGTDGKTDATGLFCPFPSQCCYAWTVNCQDPNNNNASTAVTYYDCCMDIAHSMYGSPTCGTTFCCKQNKPNFEMKYCEQNAGDGGKSYCTTGGTNKPQCTNLVDYICTVVRVNTDQTGSC